MKIVVGKMWPDRLLKFAKTILERAPLTVMFQRRWAVEFLLRPADHQEEIVGQQVQLPRFRIGLIDDHQQQPLRMLPRFGLIRTEFDDIFVAVLGRPSGAEACRLSASNDWRSASLNVALWQRVL